MKIITCRCDKTFEADLPDEFDMDRDPQVLDAILDGNFLITTCPHCGARIKPDVPLTLVSRRRGMSVRVLPEGQRRSWIEGMAGLPDTVEIIVGFTELYERALIIKEGLDPRAIEILKYFILAKAIESAPEAAETPLVSYRGRTEDGRLSFGIEGLRQGELAMLALSFDRYEKAQKDLPGLAATEPFSTFLLGPYKSVRALESL